MQYLSIMVCIYKLLLFIIIKGRAYNILLISSIFDTVVADALAHHLCDNHSGETKIVMFIRMRMLNSLSSWYPVKVSGLLLTVYGYRR